MPDLDSTALAVLGVMLVATLFRSAFGFGEALLAVPMLSFLLPVQTAVPLAVLASITVALFAVVQDWHKIHLRSAGHLIVATLFGIPFGLWMLKAVPEAIVQAVLGAIVALFALFSLFNRGRGHLQDDRSAWAFGFVAGVLGGAYGINGPPLVVYGSLRRWTPVHFRATLQAYFLPAGIVGLTGYAFTGLWTAQVNRYFLLSLPLVVLATIAGRAMNRRMHPERFTLYVHAGLLAIGVLLLWRSIAR